MRREGIGPYGLMIVVLIVGVLAAICLRPMLGLYPFGPGRDVQATVSRCYVDVSGSGDSKKSHYMVATDEGVFEVDNSLWLWLWNADEIYGRIREGSNYVFSVKGNKLVAWMFQDYPGITAVEAAPPQGDGK